MMPDRYMPDVIAPKILYDFIRAIKAPGRAARGEVLDEEEALNMALNVTGGGLATSGSVPLGSLGMGARTRSATSTMPLKKVAEISPELNLQMAKEAAEKMGLSPNPQVRMLQLGHEPGWYHGTTGDITRFRNDLLGETTGAESAKKGFFFARDPINPPQEMLKKSTDPKSIEMLKKMGKTDEEIEALNRVSFEGTGARTASGYSLIGGDREYKEAMRAANLAEKRQNWPEYEKQMQIAEDIEINRMNQSQQMVAIHGEKRDEMLDAVQKAFYYKQLPQAEAELLDKQFRDLLPYGWYTQFNKNQFDNLKQVIKDKAPKEQAANAVKAIDQYVKTRNEAQLLEKTQSGSNVMPVALRYKNPMVYDFEGSPYRDETYSSLVDKALREGKDALILRNTYDPGGSKAEMIDVGVVFEPNQIRSKFAAFDPTRTKESDILAVGNPYALPAVSAADPLMQFLGTGEAENDPLMQFLKQK
jgi:hypothetical protein